VTARVRIAKSNRTRVPQRETYHHGDLREALMSAALAAVARDGVASVSLRELARDLGVSHGAPAHHFQDRAGLFTALAAAGFERLHAELAQAVAAAVDAPDARLNAAGRAYVLFAAANPAYFEVMFHPKLLRQSDPELGASRRKASRVLQDAIAAVQTGSKRRDTSRGRAQPFDIATLNAWSIAHGLASLWLTGNITKSMAPEGIEALTRQVFKSEAR
jgi:AcrR family transcriptional regulator